MKSVFHKSIFFFKSRDGIIFLIISFLFVLFWFCLPSPLFKSPLSTVIEDKDGKLLGAKIATDGQWRFPERNHIPYKFSKCIIQFEDKNFYAHQGVDLFAIARALKQNITSKKIVSGGSTLTMQVVRLARKGKKRSFAEKLIEMIMALRLELTYNKREILSLYSSNAPFGSNVVGLDAASWRYFGREPEKLSWSESALLAVLPNAPSLIYPGKNHNLLLKKRNFLLDKLAENEIIDKETAEISKQEPLPEKPFPLPQLASHLLQRVCKEGYSGKRLRTTVDLALQERVANIVESYHKLYKSNQINNLCALVLDVKTGNVLAYIGNITSSNPDFESNVDVITAPRSTGSILKPFLFACMLNDGELLPNTLIPDIPTQIAGYAPRNYNMTYDGAVPAKRALARSLNVPAVRMLQEYGIEKFNYNLKKIGMTTLNKPPSHYGLSIILGGSEGKLWDITGMYASMARVLNNYSVLGGSYNQYDIHPPYYVPNQNSNEQEIVQHSVLDAASIYLTFEAMVEVARPDEDLQWRQYTSNRKIAWKTGTSFGYRDGWAIGVNSSYAVGVWVGNANGEGRPGLTGIQTAAPVLFNIFGVLKPSNWFDKPYDEMERVQICKLSGSRATDICEPIEEQWIQKSGLRSEACKYHRIVHTDMDEKYRVNSNCEDVDNMKHIPWFVLPPSMEWYYKSKNPSYKELPPVRSDCENTGMNAMEIIYPKQLSKIYVPIELSGETGKTVFEVAHRKAAKKIYWHLDGVFIGITQYNHQLALSPEEGVHKLTLVDEDGETLTQKFEIIGKK